ncbi:hypothetical protein LJC47_04740 [Desulfosarcina sp. OttesenSCG-928-B08]|nr:hypothetical protein [Desulfosarcina sp. OttesenSCG-928-B08]
MWKNRLPFDPSDPTNRAIMAVAASLFLVMIILVWASVSNSGKYYAIEKKGALQIWKGEFAPLGKKRIATLPGVPLPEPAKAIYCADDLYPLAFAHYMDNADALRAVPGIPDFEGIKSSLKSALSFSTTEAMRREAMDRLDTIDRTALTYRADEAARQGTIEGFNTAIALLAESAQLTTDKAEKDIINQRIAGHKASIVRLTAASTETAGAP